MNYKILKEAKILTLQSDKISYFYLSYKKNFLNEIVLILSLQ